MNQTLKLRIISPKQTIYDGMVFSVSSVNSAGKFDILPSHANFITLIEGKPIVVKKVSGEILNFNFPLAIIYTQQNIVSIYTDIQSLAIPSQ